MTKVCISVLHGDVPRSAASTVGTVGTCMLPYKGAQRKQK